MFQDEARHTCRDMILTVRLRSYSVSMKQCLYQYILQIIDVELNGTLKKKQGYYSRVGGKQKLFQCLLSYCYYISFWDKHSNTFQ